MFGTWLWTIFGIFGHKYMIMMSSVNEFSNWFDIQLQLIELLLPNMLAQKYAWFSEELWKYSGFSNVCFCFVRFKWLARQNQLDFTFLINLCKTVFRPGADLSLHFMPIANIEHLSVCTNIDKNYLFIKI